MSIKDLLQNMIRDFFIICTGILLALIAFCLIFSPQTMITATGLIKIVVGAAISTLPHLVFWSRRELSKREWQRRRIGHFAILEVTVIIYAHMFGWLAGFVFLEHLAIVVSVLLIYALVCAIGFSIARSDSMEINQALVEIRESEARIENEDEG
jgi:small-conductance mechanosensitive channel